MARRDPYYLPPNQFPLIRRSFYRRARQRWWPNFLRFLILLGIGLGLLALVLSNFQ